MHFKNRFLLLPILILVAACSETGDDGPVLDTAEKPVETGSSEAIYLSDLDRSAPQSALARQWKHGTWRLFDYTAERDAEDIDIESIHDAFDQKPDPSRTFSGTLLLAMHDSRAPEMTYSLNRTGWHRIYIGIYQKPFEGTKAVDVRLSRDASFTTVEGHEGGKDHQENRLYEVYWKTADLTGQSLHFRQITFPRIREAWVAFVKLVPLSEEQVREFEADRTNPEHKRLFVHIDPGISNESGAKETLLSLLDPLRNGDVARLYWETGMGDRVFYSSSIGRRPTETRDHGDDPDNPFYGRAYDGIESKTWRAYRKTGVEPLEVAVEFAHEHGIELHAAYRGWEASASRFLIIPKPKAASSRSIRNWCASTAKAIRCPGSPTPFPKLASTSCPCSVRWRPTTPSTEWPSSTIAGRRCWPMRLPSWKVSRPSTGRIPGSWILWMNGGFNIGPPF